MHWDDTDAGRGATAACFPQVRFKRCLCHQLAAVRRRSGDLKKFVASMVALNAHTVNRFVFDLLWQSVLKRLASQDMEWAAYVKAHVLIRTEDELWSAEWHCSQTDQLAASREWRACNVPPGILHGHLGSIC